MTDIAQFTQQEKNTALNKLILARINMLQRHPFFGNIATRMVLIDAATISWNLETAATDGLNLYYNVGFINKLTEKEVVFLVGHELFHLIFSHAGIGGRCGARDTRLWNVACDFAVNRDLIEYGVGERITTVPMLYDKKYDGLSSEEIYEKLYEAADKIDINALMKKMLDEHMDGEGEGEGEDGKEGNSSGKPTPMTAEEKAALKDQIREAMLSAAQSVGVGNVPAGMKRYIEGMTEPKMNWREVLTQNIESQVKNDFTFMKPGRRSWSCDAILPSMKREPAIECSIFLDLSGSIGKVEMRDFLSEVKGIMEQYPAYKITIATWDTKCYLSGEFTEDDGVEEMLAAEYKGGGGTDPRCIWKWCEENEHTPKQMIIFTDGEFCLPPEPSIDSGIIWLIKSTRKDFDFSYGDVIYF